MPYIAQLLHGHMEGTNKNAANKNATYQKSHESDQ